MLPGLSCAALAGATPGSITISPAHETVISADVSAYEAGGAKTYSVPSPSPRAIRLNLSEALGPYFVPKYRKNLAAAVTIVDGALVSMAHGDTLYFGFEDATADESITVTVTDTLLDEQLSVVGLVKITL
jgi:hypothetical protein